MLTPSKVPTRGPSPRLTFVVVGAVAVGLVAVGLLGPKAEEPIPVPSPPPTAAVASTAPAPPPAGTPEPYSGPVAPRTVPVVRLLESAALEPSGLTIVRSHGSGVGDAVMAVDGSVWIATPGALVHVDPASGGTRAWTLADDTRLSPGAIAAAAEGGVWLLRGEVVRRFDGEGFDEAYRLPSSAGLVTEGPDGTIWIAFVDGSVAGLHRGGPEAAATLTWVFEPPSGATIDPLALAADAAGGVWVATSVATDGQRLARFDGSAWTTYAELGLDRRPVYDIRGIAPATDGTVWLASDASLDRLGPRGWLEGAWLGTWAPRSLAVTADGSRWYPVVDGRSLLMRRISAEGIVTDWRGTPDEAFRVEENPRLLVVAHGEDVALVTAGAVYRWEGRDWRRVATLEQSPGPTGIVAVSEDEAYLTLPAGLVRLADGEVTEVPTPGDAGYVRDIVRDGKGGAWAAMDLGLLRLADDRWEPAGPSGFALAPDPAGGIAAVRTPGGDGFVVDRYAPDGTRTELPPSDLLSVPSQLTIGPDGTVWVGSSWAPKAGLASFSDGVWTLADIRGAGLTVAVGDVAVAPNGDVWVSGADVVIEDEWYEVSTAWIARRTDGRWTTWVVGKGGLARAGRIAFGPDGTTWITSTNGLIRVSGAAWSVVAPDIPVWDVSVAPDGAVWVLTPAGTGRLDPATAAIRPTGAKP